MCTCGVVWVWSCSCVVQCCCGVVFYSVFCLGVNPRKNFEGPGLQTPPKFNEKTPREKKRTNFPAGEGKKREILGLPSFWAPPSSGLHPSGLHLSGVRGPILSPVQDAARIHRLIVFSSFSVWWCISVLGVFFCLLHPVNPQHFYGQVHRPKNDLFGDFSSSHFGMSSVQINFS